MPGSELRLEDTVVRKNSHTQSSPTWSLQQTDQVKFT